MTIQTTIRNSFFLLFFSSTLYSLTPEFYALEQARRDNRIHQFQENLEKAYISCDGGESKSSNAIATCILIRNEKLQYLSPASQYSELVKIKQDLEFLEKQTLKLEEKLFFEMRFFAYCPKSVGQNFPKSLLALESLKRLQPSTPGLEFYEKEIRFLQGKATENITEEEKSVFQLEKSFGIFAGVFYAPSNGLGAGIGYKDDKLNDGPWGFGIQGAATLKPTVFGLGNVSYSKNEDTLKTEIRGFWGRENFYGIGADSIKENLQLFQTTRVELIGSYLRYLGEDLNVGIGIRMRDVRLIDYAADSYSIIGPEIQISADTLDVKDTPRHGYKVAAYGYFTKFQEFGLETRGAFPLNSSFHLNAGSSMQIQTGNNLSYAYLRLGERFYTPGVSQNRIQDKTLLSGWTELRSDIFHGLGGGFYGSANFAGATLDDMFKHRSLLGGGVFLDWRWTRAIKNNVRLDVYRFVDETSLQVIASQTF